MNFESFLEAVTESEGEDLANYYMMMSIIEMGMKGYGVEDVFSMDVEVLMKLLSLPPAPDGWNTNWGKHIVHS